MISEGNEYGAPKYFEENGSKVRAMPKFKRNRSNFQDPIADADKIDEIIITNMNGDVRIVQRLARDIKQIYTGQPYAVWKAI